jgi:hypothetical protein
MVLSLGDIIEVEKIFYDSLDLNKHTVGKEETIINQDEEFF